MADATSTGTLVLIAASGGIGALSGAALGQVVQLRRDRKQYEREDARHDRERREAIQDQDRERRQAIEDARRVRREGRYVELLTALDAYRRMLHGSAKWEPDKGPSGELREDWQPTGSDYAQASMYDELLYRTHASAVEAANAAFPVASSQVRDASRDLSDSVPPNGFDRWLYVIDANAGRPPKRSPQSSDAYLSGPLYSGEAAQLMREGINTQLAEAIQLAERLDALVREELALD